MSSNAPSPLAAPLPWDLVSEAYASEIVPHFTKYAEDALRLAGISAGARVVDVAAGPGTLALLAAARGARVSAIDFSPRMIARLEERAAREGISGIEARVGDGMALPFGEGEFDAGFSMFGLMFFPDRARGFAELRRVLRPDGVAVVSSWQELARVPALSAIFGTLKERMPELPFSDGPGPLGAPEAFRAEMEAAGFRDVAVSEAVHALEAESVEAFWASTQRSMAPIVLLRKRLGEEAWRGAAGPIGERLRDALGAGPVSVPMPANIAVGRR